MAYHLISALVPHVRLARCDDSYKQSTPKHAIVIPTEPQTTVGCNGDFNPAKNLIPQSVIATHNWSNAPLSRNRQGLKKPSPYHWRDSYLDLGRFADTAGGHRDFGRRLGEEMRHEVEEFCFTDRWYLHAWQGLQEREDVKVFSEKLKAYNQVKYPMYWEEIHGLSMGSGVDIERIWVVIGMQEILGYMESAEAGRPRGCSDLVTPNMIHHNEDGTFGLLERGRFVKFMFYDQNARTPQTKEDWAVGFCYPGALPGWGPAYNSHGVVYSINFLFPTFPTVESEVIAPIGSCVALYSRDIVFSDTIRAPLDKMAHEDVKLAFGQNLNIGSSSDGVLSVEQGPGNYADVVLVQQPTLDGGQSGNPLPCTRETTAPYLFHGNRYNREIENEPASTNAGPCYQTRQFDALYKPNFELALAQECVNESILNIMSDSDTEGTQRWRIFRCSPDTLVTLFSINCEFHRNGYVIRIWRHSGEGDDAVAETEPMWTESVQVKRKGSVPMHIKGEPTRSAL